jgi:hypothetical protein
MMKNCTYSSLPIFVTQDITHSHIIYKLSTGIYYIKETSIVVDILDHFKRCELKFMNVINFACVSDKIQDLECI